MGFQASGFRGYLFVVHALMVWGFGVSVWGTGDDRQSSTGCCGDLEVPQRSTAVLANDVNPKAQGNLQTLDRPCFPPLSGFQKPVAAAAATCIFGFRL